MAAPIARRAGVWGIAFAVLLLVSSGMVSGPLSNRPLQEITEFYSKNSTVVLVAQVVGIVAAGAFFLFATNLARKLEYGRVRVIGIVVSMAAIATAVPIVMLALGTAATSTLVRMIDLTDVVLFVVIALFLVVVGGRRSLPGWIRLLCGLVAILCVLRAVMGALTLFTILDVIAPVAFLIAVVVLAILAWRQPTA